MASPLLLLLTSLIVAAAAECDLHGAALCSKPGALTWTGGTRQRPPTPSYAGGCCLPDVRRTAAALAGTHVLIMGDSTYRYPVTFFQRSWLGCELGRRFNASGAAADVRGICQPIYYTKNWLRRPVGGFFLNFEWVRRVQDIRKTQWWRNWVLGDEYKKVKVGGSLTSRAPDAVITGSWLWHVKYSGGNALRDYEMELRSFLTDLVARPSYRNLWSKGRLYWREALPTEASPPYDSKQCEAANAVARRLLKQLAPDVRVLSQASIVTRSPPTPRGTLAMTVDGKHHHPPIAVALVQTALGVLVRDGVIRVKSVKTVGNTSRTTSFA